MKYPCILKLHTNDTNNNTYTVETSIVPPELIQSQVNKIQ